MKKITVLFIILLVLPLHSLSEESTHKSAPTVSGNKPPHTAVLKNEGGTLYSLARNHYQKADETLFDLIMQANPAISDVRKIDGEQIITLPQITAASYSNKLPDGNYRVHIGTFETYALAKLYAKNLNDSEKRLFIEPHPFSSQDTWYRLTMGDFTSKEDALKKAQYLSEKGIIFIPPTVRVGAFTEPVEKSSIIPKGSSQYGPTAADEEMTKKMMENQQGMPKAGDTIPDGIIKEYYENGRVKTIRTYKQGVPEGISQFYYDNGDPMFTHNYSNGNKDGLSRWYYRNGMVKYEYEYKGGLLDGMIYKYYQSGKLAAAWTYRNGKREGTTTSYNRDGSIKAEWNYRSDTLDGISRIFYDSGGIQYIDTYRTGRKINRKAYDNRGKLAFAQDYPLDDDDTTP